MPGDTGVWVFAGGCLGTLARASLSAAIPDPSSGFPATTLAINLLGALVLGWLLRTLALGGPDEGLRRRIRLGVGTGVLGGFTTFSTFMVQTTRLLQHELWLTALAYLSASLVGGYACAFGGSRLAHLTRRRAVSR